MCRGGGDGGNEEGAALAALPPREIVNVICDYFLAPSWSLLPLPWLASLSPA